MGYTLSFDASVKCAQGDAGGLLRHIARDVDQANGCEVRHGNKDIDEARTRLNTTLVADGKGGWVDCTDTQQIADALADRLGHVKKTLRKDAVVLRGLILQLDPEWYEQHTDTGERIDAEQHMMDWAAGTFGAENLIYVALHEDEGSRHLHVGFCPVTSDGRLAQKDWFPGPADLRKKHDEFRQHMIDAGYDVDKERKKPGRHAKRMSVEEYKDFARLQDERRDVEQQQEQLRTDRLNARDEARRRLERTSQQVRDAEQYGAAVTAQADEYARTTRKQADRDADQTRQQAEQDAARIRQEAERDAERTAAARAAAVQEAIRQKIKDEVDRAKQERDQAVKARRAAQAALQGDLATWGRLTPRPTAKALLGVLGAAVEASRQQQPTKSGVGGAYARMMAMLRAADARDNPGPAAVEGPTL